MYKSIDVYLSYAAVAAVFTLAVLPAPVLADARCNQDIGTAHYPYLAEAGPVDTDNEYKFTATVGLKEVSGQGAVACYAKTVFEDVPYRASPAPGSVGSADADQACAMVNDDGAETTAGQWRSTITRNCGTSGVKTPKASTNPNYMRCQVKYELWCGRFSPRIEF